MPFGRSPYEPLSFTKLRELAARRLDTHEPRPRGDGQPGKQYNVWLRLDVIAWLQNEAERRGNGWTPSRVLTEIIRERMERSK